MFSWVSDLPPVRRVTHFWHRYERFLVGGSLLIGFCFDLIIADRPDNPFNNALLLMYLFVAGGIIIALNIRKTRQQELEHPVEPMFLFLVLQFLFGNLSSNLLVLYGRSGTLTGSAIFIGLLLAMIIGNEFLKTRYGQLRLTISIYYILVFSYLIIAIPTFVLHQIGPLVFVASGVASLIFIALFLVVVYRVVLRGKYRAQHLRSVSILIATIFVVFNAAYFLNIIPPVPLALREIGIYHSVARLGADYTVQYEKPRWYEFWRSASGTYTQSTGAGPAYCMSAVFAPTGLATPILHTWEKYNEQTKKWEQRSRVSFAINGGRGGGYRGFSIKAVTEGKWRCNVETERGALIGREEFTVVPAQGALELASKTL